MKIADVRILPLSGEASDEMWSDYGNRGFRKRPVPSPTVVSGRIASLGTELGRGYVVKAAGG